jgi:hypothetical protein
MRRLELVPFPGPDVVGPSDEQVRAAVLALPPSQDMGLHFFGEIGVRSSMVITNHEGLGHCVVIERREPGSARTSS